MPVGTVYASNQLKETSLVFKSRYAYHRTFAGFSLIDLWNNVPLYGKVDTNYNIIYPSESFLKSVSDEHGDVFALNFVTDAFQKMGDYLRQGELNGKISPESAFFYPLRAADGWSSLNQQHYVVMNALWKGLLVYLDSSGANRSIYSFDDFIIEFSRFLDIAVQTSAITKSGFIMKSYCPHSVSGLTLELTKEKYSDDFVKVRKFLRDPAFPAFVDAATKFGFFVDKNAPWRLIANLASPAWETNPCLSEIMESYGGLSLDNIFDTYYYKTYKQDVELLKFYAFEFYNALVKAQSEISIPEISSGGEVFVKKVKRKPILSSSMESKYSNLFWLQMYFDVRLKEMEARNDISERSYETIKKRIEMLYYRNGYNVALEFVNEKLKIVLKKKLDQFAMGYMRGKRTVLTTQSTDNVMGPSLITGEGVVTPTYSVTYGGSGGDYTQKVGQQFETSYDDPT